MCVIMMRIGEDVWKLPVQIVEGDEKSHCPVLGRCVCYSSSEKEILFFFFCNKIGCVVAHFSSYV